MISFSVIIPLYNKERTIRNTIESVLQQSYPNFEIIVVNDGSQDESVSIVKSISDNRIHLFSKENGGPGAARNFGVQKATNSWIIFLDADDLLLKEALSVFVDAIVSYPQQSVFVANFYNSMGVDKVLFSEHYSSEIVRNPFRLWFFRELMPRAGACVISKEIALNSAFKEYLRRSEDVEHSFNLFRQHEVVRIENPVMVYRLDQAAESKNLSHINRDFQGHLDFEGKRTLWERICLYELYVEAKNNYPDEVDTVYPDMKRYFLLKVAYHLAFRYRSISRNRKY